MEIVKANGARDNQVAGGAICTEHFPNAMMLFVLHSQLRDISSCSTLNLAKANSLFLFSPSLNIAVILVTTLH